MDKVVVYSGSFNPLHIGHKEIIKRLSKDFDEVRIIVTPKNPLKDTISADSANDRFDNVKKEIEKENLDNVIVDNIELLSRSENFTYNTLMELFRRTGRRYCLAVGGDCLEHFTNWKEWENILTQFGVVVFPRKGYDEKKFIKELYNHKQSKMKYMINVINADIPKISSTELRKANIK